MSSTKPKPEGETDEKPQQDDATPSAEQPQASEGLKPSSGITIVKVDSSSTDDDDGDDARWRKEQRAKQRHVQKLKEKRKKSQVNEKTEGSGGKPDAVKVAIEKGEWRETKDPTSGKTYYHNPKTNKTTWDLYAELGVSKPGAPAVKKVDKVKEALDKGTWKESKDPSSGKTYYHNPTTNETTWDLKEKLGVVDDDGKAGEASKSSSSSSSSADGYSSGMESDHKPAKPMKKPSTDALASLLLAPTPTGGSVFTITPPRMLAPGVGAAPPNADGAATDGASAVDQVTADIVKNALESGEWVELSNPETKAPFFFNPTTQQSTNNLHALLAPKEAPGTGGVEGEGEGLWVPIPDPSTIGGTLLLNTVTKVVKSDPNSRVAPSSKSQAEMLGLPTAPPVQLGLAPLSMGMAGGGGPQERAKASKKKKPDEKTLKRIKRLLKSGEWIMFFDPLTNLPCYRHADTGRVSFDLVAEVRSSRDGKREHDPIGGREDIPLRANHEAVKKTLKSPPRRSTSPNRKRFGDLSGQFQSTAGQDQTQHSRLPRRSEGRSGPRGKGDKDVLRSPDRILGPRPKTVVELQRERDLYDCL